MENEELKKRIENDTKLVVKLASGLLATGEYTYDGELINVDHGKGFRDDGFCARIEPVVLEAAHDLLCAIKRYVAHDIETGEEEFVLVEEEK